MSKPCVEPEVVNAELRAIGCPYEPLDPATKPWLEGYRAGCAYAFDEANRIQKEILTAKIESLKNG